MDLDPLKTWLRRQNPLLLGLAGSALAVGLIVALLVAFDWHDEVIRWLQWIDRQGVWTPLLFIVLMALVVVLLLPGVFFTIGAGFVFGVVKGTVYVVLGTTLGAAIAYAIAHRFFGERAARWLAQRLHLKLMAEEMIERGFQIVLLSRLVPFFPSKLANYFFGLTGVRFKDFVLGTLIGIVPFSLHNVWLGAMAALGLKGVTSPLQWGLYLLGFGATVALIFHLQRIARDALEKYRQEASR
ncbi:hypothetical protein MIN45_P1088 [Methylomarinovum tepidoasis]|uniref:TVP38/TMEM64 family membrane protein n=1 Tax=Methylomarinovum tepidoasis TaxID=2840183 RepID=A0AAU9D154_9GAMM|nr:VTT domain-containing protein [Methylomarinovum sp. IN45]BCX88719.1 hypothetical protein MIN45_P1088 [Methylomarinovum sp. IN45]